VGYFSAAYPAANQAVELKGARVTFSAAYPAANLIPSFLAKVGNFSAAYPAANLRRKPHEH